MKKDDLVKVIRAIVKQELKKELPTALAQVFAQMMGQAQRPAVHSMSTVRYIDKPMDVVGKEFPHKPSAQEMPNEQPEELDETALLKEQLREMFNGDAPIQRSQPQAAQQQPKKQFTNNPLLNEVLNQTRPFNSSERMAMRVGGGGVGAMAPGVAMAAAEYGGATAPAAATTGVGQMMDSNELSFLNKIPGMPGADQPMLASPPTGHAARLTEGQEGGPAPMETLGAASALDFKNSSVLPENIRNVLSRDYRSLVRAMDKGKKK